MRHEHWITGQKVDPAKLEQARAMRRNMTPFEKRLWAELRANRLDGLHFRRQQIIAGFIVDFYCHAAALVVEVDGPAHDRQSEYDAERDRILAAHGLQTLRIRNEEITEKLPEVLDRIREACRARVDRKASPWSQHPDAGEHRPPPRIGEGMGEGSP